MSDGIAADYAITSSQVRDCVLDNKEIVLNEEQLSRGFTTDFIKKKIWYACKFAINALDPMYFGSTTEIREQAQCIINSYGKETLFNEICEGEGIPIEPCNFDLIIEHRNLSPYESDYDEDGNTIIEEDYEEDYADPYDYTIQDNLNRLRENLRFHNNRGDIYKIYLTNHLVGEEEVDRSIWSNVPAPMA